MIQSHKGMAKHIFQYNPDDKLDVKKLLKIMKPQFAPVGNSKRQFQEIVMAKLIAFLKAVEGELTFCSCYYYYYYYHDHYFPELLGGIQTSPIVGTTQSLQIHLVSKPQVWGRAKL